MGGGAGDRSTPGPWPLPIRIELSGTAPVERAEAAERGLRARPGVAVFVGSVGGNDETISVSACGDLRAFVAGRLRGEGPRADLSEVAVRVEACECGSGFEADLACDAVMRARTPEAAARAAASRAVWFVHLDPSGEVPACRVVDACDAERDPATLIGPFARRSHAEAWAGMLDTRFELCREPATLAKRPDAQACPYKDMGACPAPCDGSEPMEIYRARAESARVFDGSLAASALDAVRRELDAAVGGMDFERASDLKASVDVLSPASGASWVCTMDRFGALAVLPAGKKGWARIVAHRSGRSVVLGDVRAGADDPAGVILDMLSRCGLRRGAERCFGASASDGVALVFAHARSSRKTRGRIVPIAWRAGEGQGTGLRLGLDRGLDPGVDRADLVRAVRRAGGVEADIDAG